MLHQFESLAIYFTKDTALKFIAFIRFLYFILEERNSINCLYDNSHIKTLRNVSYIKKAITRNPFFLHFIFSLHGICNIRHYSLSCDIIWSMNIEICQASPGYLHMFLNISISFVAIMQNFPVNRKKDFFIFVSTASKMLSFTMITTFVSCQLQAKYNNYLFDSPLSYHYFLSLMSSYENCLLPFSKDFFMFVVP